MKKFGKIKKNPEVQKHIDALNRKLERQDQQNAELLEKVERLKEVQIFDQQTQDEQLKIMDQQTTRIQELEKEVEKLKDPTHQEISTSELLKKIGIAKMTAKIMYDNLHADLIQEIYNEVKQLQSENKRLKEGIQHLEKYYGNFDALHYFFFDHNTMKSQLLKDQKT